MGQFQSNARTAQALAELFATPVSEGTVATISERAADELDGFLDTVRYAIADAEVAGFDESGLRVADRETQTPPYVRSPGAAQRCRSRMSGTLVYVTAPLPGIAAGSAHHIPHGITQHGQLTLHAPDPRQPH
jgi:hypothetical protein